MKRKEQYRMRSHERLFCVGQDGEVFHLAASGKGQKFDWSYALLNFVLRLCMFLLLLVLLLLRCQEGLD